MLIKRNYEREEMLKEICGWSDLIYPVNEHKTIRIDTEKDNSITYIWLCDDRKEAATICEATGLIYVENICDEYGNLDTDMLAMAEKCFEVAYEA